MPLNILHSDITDVLCDVIVNPTDSYYSGSGGTDRAVHRAAGPGLYDECLKLPPLGVGEVAVTPGLGLPCRHIIHTVGPVWQGGGYNESVLLRSCYMNALFKAHELGAQSVAFPLIASGTFGFPKDKVLRIAVGAISDYLFSAEEEMNITICIKSRDAYELSCRIALREYLDDRTAPRFFAEAVCAARPAPAAANRADEWELADTCLAAPFSEKASPSLADWIKQQDDSFAVMLLKLIDQKGLTDVQCYKKANVSKGTFWKINNDPKYKPSKATVLAFAIALELTLEETQQLLRTVGMSLSHSSLFDLILEFYITNGCYDIFEINAALYQYDQVCLGC